MARHERGKIESVSVALLAVGVFAGLMKAIFPLPLPQLITLEAATHVAVASALPLLMLFALSLTLPESLAQAMRKRILVGDADAARNMFYMAWAALTLLGAIMGLVIYLTAGSVAEQAGITVRSAMQMPSLLGNESTGQVINYASSVSSMALYVAIAFSLLALKGYFLSIDLTLLAGSAEAVGQLIKLLVGLLLGASWLKNGPAAAASGAVIGYAVGEGVTLILMALAYFFNLGHKRLYMHREGRWSGKSKPGLLGELGAYLGRGVFQALSLSVIPACFAIDAFSVVKKLVDQGFSQAQSLDVYGCLAAIVTPLILFAPLVMASQYKHVVARTQAYLRAKDGEGLKAFIRSQCKFSLVIALLVLLLLLGLGEQIVGVLASKVLMAEDLLLTVKMVRIGSFGAAAAVMGMGVAPVIIGMDRSILSLTAAVMAVAVKALVMLWAMNNPAINVLGAVFSTTMALLCFGGLNTAFALQYADPPATYWLQLLMPLLAAIVSGALINLILLGIWPDFFATFNGAVISIVAAAAIYVLICMVTRALSREDVEQSLMY